MPFVWLSVNSNLSGADNEKDNVFYPGSKVL